MVILSRWPKERLILNHYLGLRRVAKYQLKADIDKMFSIADDLSEISREVPQMMANSLDGQLDVAVSAMKANWASMAGNAGDFVYDSFGKQIGGNGRSPTPNPDGTVSASVGAFKVDHVAAAHGRRIDKQTDANGKMLRIQPSAAQVAWWHEFGTKNITGKNFMSSAFYSSLSAQEKVFADNFQEQYERKIKG